MREIILSITVFSLLNISSASSQKQTILNNNMIYNFNSDNSLKNWNIVDDDVMGGVSSSNIVVKENGIGLFTGHVSTKNNGGFSSIRYQFKIVDISKYKSFVIRVKGDGKNYQFRVKSNLNQYHSYKYKFETNNKWQEIEIKFNQLEPTFRGRMLSMPSFSNVTLQEICFLISNKKEEDFSLEIDYVKIQ
tara:strand:- start:1055 stop:1624 length:570 start_codon:yes stop_codon:yes gene_type:complete